MEQFVKRYPFWTLVIAIVVAAFLWLVFSPWSPELVAALGPKRTFLGALLNGITLGALYFLVASGFTLIFGLMRIVNLAHGSLFLIGGYLGFEIASRSGSWFFAFPVVFIVVGCIGLLMQYFIFSKIEGQDLRQTLVSIGMSIILADLMLWYWGAASYSVDTPDVLSNPMTLPIVSAINRSGVPIYITHPSVRIWILFAAIVLGIGMWLVLNRTRLGMLIRAGVDDREILAASGVRINLVFLGVFAFGAGLAGIAGIVGGTFQALSPGIDARFLLASLVVVIVGGMGSIAGAAVGSLIIGIAEQVGLAYAPTYSVVFTFLIMAAVLAFRPQGLFGSRR
ncbi:MAG: branched-chain amino acid ABC transporter permease [Beijerinckiaceae bacterium]